MRNLPIGRQIALTMGVVVVAFTLAMTYAISQLRDQVYAERYSTLRTAVETAVSLMASYDARAKAGEMSAEEAQARAFEAVTALRFDPDGYFFGVDGASIMRLHINPKLIGKDFSGVTDKNGAFFINDILAAGQAGGGVTIYPWPKPGDVDGEAYDKASFSLEYKPWGIVIGTGVYIDDLDAEVNGVIIQAVEIAAVLVALAAGLSIWVLRGLVRPLTGIKEALTAVAEEDTQAEVPGGELRNEVGAMARATMALQAKIAERHAMVEAQERQRAELDATREAAAARQRADAEQQARAMSSVAGCLERMSQGDLRVRCERLDEPYAALAVNLNAALTKLETAMAKVRLKGEDIRGSKDDIQNSSNNLAHRTEMQAATLEETSAAIQELAQGVRKTADGAGEAAKLVRGVAEEAEQNMGSATEAVTAMRAIEEAAQEIKAIVSVIDEIAFQTNLLALNAAVEAARVGEAGKGFAVVAQEVRELASRSGSAAKKISDQIREATARIETGVRLVGAAGDSFRTIVGRINQTTEVVTEIAEGASEQDTSLGSIAASVNDLDVATQANAAMAEESSASAQALGQDIEALAELLAEFQTEGHGRAAARAA